MRQVLLFLLFLFLPIISCPFLFNGYELPKAVFFRLVIISLISLSWLKVLSGKKNLVIILVLAYFFWLILTSLFGFSWPRSLMGNYFRQQGLLTLSHLFFLFLMIAFWGERLSRFWLTLAITIGSLLAGWQGSLANPNFTGGYLIITLPFTIYLIQQKKLLFPLFLIQAWLIVVTESRIAIALLVLAIFFYIAHFLKKYWFFFLIFLVLVNTALPFLGETSPYENRTKIWQKSIEAFQKKPIMGWGWGNFEYAFEAVLVRLIEADIELTGVRVDRAHSEFLEVLVASGFIGLGIYLTMIVVVFRSLLHCWQNTKDKNWWLALILSLAIFVIRSQVNPLSLAELAIFWLVLGFAASSKVKEEKVFDQKGLRYLVAFGFFWLAVFNLRSLTADFLFKKAFEAEKTGCKKAAILFKRVRQIFPWEEVYQLKDKEYND